ncbi:IclR family transcriptional regulator [Desulforamulus aeronauticus]|uniref:Transcriptional regulator, IclR family n=1 Tax=Desulforamulus aeronauticus DSM 10349 TaxID=1121421 RepID=A0A1M6VVX3_9FIRM|nr:IclR family transcriptional regulator [Desulforamulus aeronauticus]SHK85610.1 transcriptional regulator, IclR family [Desulforamulus aeronauticus DSM 10349]
MNSIEKVLWILNRLGEEPYELNLTTLANEMNTVKSGVHKTLGIMMKQGFIIQNPETKKYSVGPALYRLGKVYDNRVGIWGITKPIIMEVAEITQETISIGIREGDHAILAYKIDSTLPVRYVEDIGIKYPMNGSAIGKVLAAYHDTERVKELLNATKFIKHTPNSIVEPEAILQEYQKIRDQGYAISDEERFLESFGIAVPIMNDHKNVWSCLCITGPKVRFTSEKINSWIQLLKSKANEISILLA